ncbi:hypothetical protein MUP59_05965, partial [Candidatus Bathyarchaeota archaeon]|nr:hypothetical protein [Candidatus Bathyarchaeota archaeon]
RTLLAVAAIIIGTFLVTSNMMVHFTDSGPQTLLSIGPERDPVNVGEVFVVSANISCVSGLKEWKMDIRWDPSIIELNVSDALPVEEGSFFKAFGITTIFSYSDYVAGSGNLSTVKCYINQTMSNGVTGSGTLLRLRFKAVAPGTTLIEFSDSKLSSFGVASAPITHNRPAGNVTVESIPTNHDIAVEFDPPSNLLKSSQIMLNGTVRNLGNTAEHRVNLSLYVDNSQTNTTEIAELAADSQCGFELEWIGATEGSHNVTVYALPVAGESNSSNNAVKKTIYVGTAVLHDLAISFEPALPRSASLGDLVYIEAIVQNNGTSSEEGLEAAILVNSQQVNRSVIRLAVGESYGLSYQLNITSRLSYNVTAFVTTVVGELDTINNREESTIKVVDSSEKLKILVVSDDDGKNSVGYKRGTSLPEFESILQSASLEHDIWIESAQGHPPLDLLKTYDLVIWTCGDIADYNTKMPDTTDGLALMDYQDQGGNILLEGQRSCYGRYYRLDFFAGSTLHVNYQTSNNVAPLKVTDAEHPLVMGLPSKIPWSMQPLDGADGVYPKDGASKILAFDDAFIESGAVIAYNGANEGAGSVVVLTFPIYWLNTTYRNPLIYNSVYWLTRQGIGAVYGKIVNAPPESVYFVYSDPDEIGARATYDAAAGTSILSLCKNPQYQGFTKTSDWFLPSGCVNSTRAADSIFVLIGRPGDLIATRYFEEMGLSPIRSARNATHYLLLDASNATVAAADATAVDLGLEDLMIIQTFKSEGNTILVLYGFNWRGTWAAGLHFSALITANPQEYSESFCVLSWEDSTGDGVPQQFEVQRLQTS